MSKNVLIITNKEDLTVDYVVKELQKREVNYYRFNTEDISHGIDLFFDGSEYLLKDNIKKRDVNLASFDSVYYRRPKLPAVNNSLSVGEKYFILGEFETYLEGVYRHLSDKYWLNSVFDIRTLENKMYQIVLARELGFLVPDLNVSSTPEKSLEFINKNEKTIFKPLKTGFIDEANGKGKIIYTSRVDDSFVDGIERNRGFPVYVQKEIEKECDVRLTIVGRNVYAAKIMSQISKNSQVDWRRSEHMLKHEKIRIPSFIERKCLDLCERYSLDFAAIDFVLDKDGGFWFLEINPNGQWAWIEEMLQYPISEKIVTSLLEGTLNEENS